MSNQVASHSAQAPWPEEIRRSANRRSLIISFDDGAKFEIPAEFLRVSSPSAEVQGHSPDQRKTIGGKKEVEILRIEAIGNYAIRLVFDDMHDSGIYGWGLLYQFGRDYPVLWQSYLDELSEKGLSRERAGSASADKVQGHECGKSSCGCKS